MAELKGDPSTEGGRGSAVDDDLDRARSPHFLRCGGFCNLNTTNCVTRGKINDVSPDALQSLLNEENRQWYVPLLITRRKARTA